MFRKYFFAVPFCCLFILSIATSNAIGQTTGGNSVLPVAARESIDKGIVAAKIPDYLLAARHFEDARKIAPESAEIFFNLGLAESKIPGRELRAINWFDAYLFANANSANGAVIKDLIVELNKKNKSNILLMLDMLEEVLKQSSSWKNIEQVAELRIKAGDLTGAKRIIDGYDVKGGSGRPEIRNAVLLHIIQSQIAARDTLGARVSLAAAVKADFPNIWDKVHALAKLALLQVNMKDSAGARNTFADAINFIANRWSDLTKYGLRGTEIIQMFCIVASAQFKAGDLQGAENTLATSLKSARLFEEAKDKKSAEMMIEEVYLENGYFEKAKNIIESVEHWDYDWERQNYITRIQIAISKKQKSEGDIQAALETAGLIQGFDFDKSEMQKEIAELQFNSGDTAGARSTLSLAKATVELLDDKWRNKIISLTDIAILQAKMGDIKEAKAILKRADKLSDKIPKNEPGGFNPDVWAERKYAQLTVVNAKQAVIGLVNGNQTAVKTDPLPRLDPKSFFYELSRAPFLDLAGYLISINEKDPGRFFTMVYEPVEQIITAEVKIEQMLKEQDIVKQ